MSKIKLTKVTECIEDLGELAGDTTTAGLVQFGLRLGAADSEYYLAHRLQEMRKLALKLIVDSLEEGNAISDSTLKLVDVEREVTETKRFCRRA